VIKLRKKVGNEALQERGKLLPTHRYYTVSHRMTAVEPIIDGRYLRAESQQKALAAAEAVSPLNLKLATPEPIAIGAQP
jgi:NAD(P)H-quinone oxidoreductase subunit K